MYSKQLHKKHIEIPSVRTVKILILVRFPQQILAQGHHLRNILTDHIKFQINKASHLVGAE